MNNPQDEADQFFEQLCLLKKGQTAAQSNESIEVASQLLEIAKANSPDPDFVRNLAQLLLAAQRQKQKATKWDIRKRLSLAAAAALLIALIVLVPPLRSLAQDIIHQIGEVSITNEPSPGERMLEDIHNGTLSPTMIPGVTVTPPPPLNVEQASKEVGFPVYVPGYLPVGFRFRDRDTGTGSEEPRSVTSWYQDRRYGEGELFISQIAENGPEGSLRWTFDIGNAPVQDVAVGSYQGIWIQGYAFTAFPLTDAMKKAGIDPLWHFNLLIWEQDGFTFVIMSEMPFELTRLVAESLTTEPPFAPYTDVYK